MMLDILDAMPTPGYLASPRVSRRARNADQFRQYLFQRHSRVYPERVLGFHQNLWSAHLDPVLLQWIC